MIKFIRQWMLQRKLARLVKRAPIQFSVAASKVLTPHTELLFYPIKQRVRYNFPGAMIEIAEGVVTVVQNGLVAKVRV